MRYIGCQVWIITSLVLVAMVKIVATETLIPSDGCDWEGSGLDYAPRKGVQAVYLRCSQGRVDWAYPRSALRIVLRLPSTQGSESEFKGCVRIRKSSRGGRLFVEGHRRLHPLWAPGESSDLVRCFTSRYGQVALYLEADPIPDQLAKDVITLEYDLEARTADKLYDDLEDCRPCTDEEILHHYCSSDIVVVGTMAGVRHMDEARKTELRIKVSRVHRKNSLPVNSGRSWDLSKYVNERYRNYVNSMDSVVRSGGEEVVVVARQCNVRQGEGRFLFLGRRRWGDTLLKCAPRYEDWVALKRRTEKSEKAQCQLET